MKNILFAKKSLYR